MISPSCRVYWSGSSTHHEPESNSTQEACWVDDPQVLTASDVSGDVGKGQEVNQGMTESIQNGKGSRRLSERVFTPIVLICLIATAILGGFAYYQKRQIEIRTNELNRAKEKADGLQKELELLKGETSSNTDAQISGGMLITIAKGESGKLDEDFRITVTGIAFKPDNSSYTVSARIAYKDLPEMQIRDAEIGSVIRYPREHGYLIQVTKVGSEFASFSIAKNP